MAKLKLIVSDPESGKANVLEVEGGKAQALIGRHLGEVIDGSPIGMSSTNLRISGGCDRDGIPMRPDVHGGAKKYIVLSGGIGFKPRRPGERKRKLVRGSMITDETYQVNLVKVTGAQAVAIKEIAPPKPVAKPTIQKPAPEKPKKKVKKPSGKKPRR
jgi:small subunit ribosomal protein S6e